MKVPFLVPIASVTGSGKEFNFLLSMHKRNGCGEPSGVSFFTTTMGFAHGDMLL